jgi:hypothetical protein
MPDSVPALPENLVVESVSGLRKDRILGVFPPEKRVQWGICRSEESAQWPVNDQKGRQPPRDVPASPGKRLDDDLDVLPPDIRGHRKVREQSIDRLLDNRIGLEVRT